jgi:hypothetical protein
MVVPALVVVSSSGKHATTDTTSTCVGSDGVAGVTTTTSLSAWTGLSNVTSIGLVVSDTGWLFG